MHFALNEEQAAIQETALAFARERIAPGAAEWDEKGIFPVDVIREMTKPVVAFVAGAGAPPGRRMGHAGAIISGQASTASHKKAALQSAGAAVVDNPAEIGATVLRVLEERSLR